jgi:hypothetical protein
VLARRGEEEEGGGRGAESPRRRRGGDTHGLGVGSFFLVDWIGLGWVGPCFACFLLLPSFKKKMVKISRKIKSQPA